MTAAVFTGCFSILINQYSQSPWAPAGGQGGALAPPLEFEKMTSYAAVLQNTLKFSLAPSALALDTLYFSL